MTNVWIDDERQAPNDAWLWFKSAEEFYNWLQEPCGNHQLVKNKPKYIGWQIDKISLDNDLGGELEGYDIVKELVDKGVCVNWWNIHSANIVARGNMVNYLQNAMKHNVIKQSAISDFSAKDFYEVEAEVDNLQRNLTRYLSDKP